MRELHINNTEHIKCRGGIISVTCRFQSEIIAIVNGQRLNAKSIMNTSAIVKADAIVFLISGVDEENTELAIKELYN